jgi:hypothetical protein
MFFAVVAARLLAAQWQSHQAAGGDIPDLETV